MYRKKDSLDSYKKAIRAKFNMEQNGIYASFLLQPSRAKLRDLCVERLKNNNSIDDLTSFRLFSTFEFESFSQAKMNKITDKFRPIEDFYLGNSDLADLKALEIAAILVDYHPRPFIKFSRKNDGLADAGVLEKNENNLEIKEEKPIKNYVNSNIEDSSKPISNLKKRIGIGILASIGLIGTTYTTKELFFSKPSCMQWQHNHYESVSCDTKSMVSLVRTIPFDEHVATLEKITVSDTTTFFIGNKSKYFYCKINDEIEVFNQAGEHPITGQHLKPLTKHMIKKYIYKNEN